MIIRFYFSLIMFYNIGIRPCYAFELDYTEKVYDNKVHTITFHHVGAEGTLPIIRLGTDDQLELGFDYFSDELQYFSYTLIYCNENWTKSSLGVFEYLDGFEEEQITDSKVSINTRKDFFHYKAVFPSGFSRLKLSGNYLLLVFKDDINNGEPDPVFSRRFYVTENKIKVTAAIERTRNVSSRDELQKLSFQLDVKNLPVANALAEIKVQVRQNQRWDNMAYNIKPDFVHDNILKFDNDYTCNFRGGNEFRKLDMRSFRVLSEDISRLFEDTVNEVYLKKNFQLDRSRYLYRDDANGRFYIRTFQDFDNALETDYAYVNFTLSPNFPYQNGELYVVGDFSNWKPEERYKMTYDTGVGYYRNRIILKQGYYDYAYALLHNGETQFDLDPTEGSFFETENDYEIFVYFRQQGTFYDRLVSVYKVNSRTNF